MLSFENDYSSTAAPEILRRMQETADQQISGYGADGFCQSAAAKIAKACDAPESKITFLAGGTQTNQTVLDAITPQDAGIVCVDSAHINVHEAGAIEATGHKVLAIAGKDGKLEAQALDDFCQRFYADANHEHMVAPGSVYVSQPTEYGTLYSREELAAIAQVAHDNHMPLYVDGARLAYALTAASNDNDMTLADLARIADVFTIGGTKCGAMCGEAVVFTRGDVPARFTALVKRRGALLAKGWLLGLQFDVLFTDDLYFKLGKHANVEADKIREALMAKGYDVEYLSSTNQIFVAMTREQAERLQKSVKLGFMENLPDGRVLLRICTSWATTDDQVKELIALL